MNNRHIASIHLGYSAEEKMTPAWWKEAKTVFYNNANNVNLLAGKNVQEIEDYASGKYSMTEFKRLFSEDKKVRDDTNAESFQDYDATTFNTDIVYQSLPLLPPKLNSAESVIERVPIEVTVEAIDALAWEKKKEDVLFLKNKELFEAPLQELSDKMNLGKVDLGSTKYTATQFSSSPYGLDLNEADELQVFIDILSSLAVEAALETAEQAFWEIKQCDLIKGMWIKDQLRYGVSAHQSYSSSMTGLPDVDYVFPGEIYCPPSRYPDYRDTPQRLRPKTMSVIEMFNKFGDEIGTEEDLQELVNSNTGYFPLNNQPPQLVGNFNQAKVTLQYVEIKSVDWIGIVPARKNSQFRKITLDEKEVIEFKGEKRWAQNTYCAWWLTNTDKFFKITKLNDAHREQGQEQIQGFSSYIFKSVPRSPVELSIPENKKAQIADMKMQFAVIKAKKSGVYIDLKYLRGAMQGLRGNDKYNINKLIDMALKDNDFIGDSEGFDGKNEGQFMPIKEVIGGLRNDLVGYMQVIQDAENKISKFTGINDQLSGQAANPEGLVGMQKLLINGSVNSIGYVNRAIENHCVNLFNSWYIYIKDAVEAGGKRKQAIQNLIGSKKVNLIDAIGELPMHQMGLTVTVSQREEERQEYRNEVARLKQLGVINTIDDYMLSAIKNPKDKMALLAVKTKQFERKSAQKQQDAYQQQQVLMQQQGQNAQAQQQAKTQGKKEEIYAQGDVSAQIYRLAAQIGLSDKQVDAALQKSLQSDRGQDQLNKNLRTLEAKSQLENQKPYGE